MVACFALLVDGTKSAEYHCRVGKCRRRELRNLAISLPRGRVAATKNLRGAVFVAAGPGPGNETQEILLYCCRVELRRRRKQRNLTISLPSGTEAATKNLRGTVLVAAAPDPGDEKPSRRSSRCRRTRPRQRNARNLVVSLPRGIVAATKTKKSCDIIAARNCGGDEN